MTHIPFASGPALDLEVDYAVVGSGPGGASAAVTLARGGATVAVCEAGPWRDARSRTTAEAARELFADWGQLMAGGRSMIPLLQASCAGGTAVINSAIASRTPGEVLAHWREGLGVGDAFTEQAVWAAQEQLEAELGVVETPTSLAHQSDLLFLDALRKRGLEGHPTMRYAVGCRASSNCLTGCPTDSGKWSPQMDWLPEVMERGGMVLSCAPVDRVVFEGARAVGVEGRFRRPDRASTGRRATGSRFTVRARRGVLVAASATGSAPLLARSGVVLPALGGGWRAHPGSAVIGVYPEPLDVRTGATQGAASMALRRRHGVKLETLSLPVGFLAGRLAGGGTRLMETLEAVPRMASWVTAVNAEAVGTVRASHLPAARGAPYGRSVVRYQPTRRDTAHLRAGAVELARLHFEAGAEAVMPGVHGLPGSIGPDGIEALRRAPLDNRCWNWMLTHLFGGCVLGGNPGTSVVGPNLEVWGRTGLHVVDASVIPTTLGTNPQHTILAMARITAERLLGDGDRA